jgi:hypothetical protein
VIEGAENGGVENGSLHLTRLNSPILSSQATLDRLWQMKQRTLNTFLHHRRFAPRH